ncbi:MAG TPA: 3-oxoacyl-[acyl-carrier-protein] synthase III C-terminal domain-containing protein [Anaerolineales bacterium]
MTAAFVDHFSYALGNETRSVEETYRLDGITSTPAALISAGFRQHHVCRPGTTAYDLARAAVELIRLHLDDVGAIIYATCLPENGTIGDVATFAATRDVKHLMDFPASHLQSEFGLQHAAVIGLNQQACTGMLGSLRIARALLTSEPDLQRVLCVTADRFPDNALYEQTYNLISDGAAACIVSRHGGRFRILATHALTNGALATASDDETAGTFFSYAHRAITSVLQRACLSAEDIRWVVPQNMNVKAWQILARLLRIPEERICFPTMPDVGHVISGDNVINLCRLIDQDAIQSGDRLLLFMAGYGLNWQCVILEQV